MATKAASVDLATLNKLQNEAAKLRARIAAAKAKIKPLEEQFNALEDEILHAMIATGTEQHRVKAGTYSVARNTVPEVTDWTKVDAYILKHKALDLLHRRLTSTAWAARLEAGEHVPGVEPKTVVKLQWRGAK